MAEDHIAVVAVGKGAVPDVQAIAQGVTKFAKDPGIYEGNETEREGLRDK